MIDTSLYCAHAQKGMKAYNFLKLALKSGTKYHEYIYCVDEDVLYKLLNEWNTKYIGQLQFIREE